MANITDLPGEKGSQTRTEDKLIIIESNIRIVTSMKQKRNT